MEQSKKSKFSIELILGISSTLLLIALAVAYLTLFNKWQEFPLLKLNEFGDLIAGFFGSLAFIWLVVAVFVQKKELKLAINEYREQSLALKGTQQLQTLQMSLSLFQSGMEVLRAITIDILLQLISLDEETPNESHDAAEKLYDPKEGYSVFKIQQHPTLYHKLKLHSKIKESLDVALSRIAAGDLNAVHALALKMIDYSSLERALTESGLTDRSRVFVEICDRYEKVRKDLIVDLKMTNAPSYLLSVVTHDHVAKLGISLDDVTGRSVFFKIYNAFGDTFMQK